MEQNQKTFLIDSNIFHKLNEESHFIGKKIVDINSLVEEICK